MRRLFAVSLFALLVAAPAVSAPAPEESWGKAGVSLAQYRQDAIDCGLQGYYLDISKTEDAKAFVTASRQLDAVTNGASAPNVTGTSATGPSSTDSVDQMVLYANQQQRIVENVRPQQRYRNIKQMLLSKTDECLVQRGYSKFRLTGEQRHRLRKLKFGSDERRAYLYRLASDPVVLASQRAVAQAQ
jgi:hypothetical protein